jgi:hypothetical protein
MSAPIEQVAAPHWSDGEIFLNLEGNPICIFGKPTGEEDSSGASFFYRGAKTVAEAQGVHFAWLNWRDADQAISGTKKVPDRAVQRAADLKAAYERLLATIGQS